MVFQNDLSRDNNEPARASQCFEKVAGINICHIFIGMVLEELLAAGRATETTQHVELEIMHIRYAGAAIQTQGLRVKGLWIKVGGGSEETAR